MSEITFDVIVIGRGIIGASITWKLAQSGLNVASIDAHQRGQATKAAAGMLAPLAESNSLPELAKFGIPALQMYPEFLAEVEGASGTSVPMLGPGILRVAISEEEEEQLKASFARQSQSPFPVQLLDAGEAITLEPAIAPTVRAAVLSTAEKHIVPTTVIEALTTIFKQIGVTMYSDTIMRVRPAGGDWSVEATGVTVKAKQIVFAAGAWSREVLKPLRFDPPITPLKGQLLAMKYRRTQPPAHTVYAHSTYIVPRSQSEVLLGATEEPDAGFDASTTSEAIASLRERGARIVPSVADASVQRGIVGLRPASPDRLPLIGRVPGIENAFIAAGHGRNGILLAPLTANMVRDLMVDGIEPPESVNPARFETSV